MPTAKKAQSSAKTPAKTEEKEKPTSKVGVYQITSSAAAAAEQIAAELHLPAAAVVDLAVREWTRSWIDGQHDEV